MESTVLQYTSVLSTAKSTDLQYTTQYPITTTVSPNDGEDSPPDEPNRWQLINLIGKLHVYNTNANHCILITTEKNGNAFFNIYCFFLWTTWLPVVGQYTKNTTCLEARSQLYFDEWLQYFTSLHFQEEALHLFTFLSTPKQSVLHHTAKIYYDIKLLSNELAAIQLPFSSAIAIVLCSM
jgi:hypothetical protein